VSEPTETFPPADGQTTDTRPPINAAWLTRMRTTKPDFLAKLFAVFTEDEPKRITALGDAVCRGDLDTVRYLAHSIKGAAATLGMERLCDAARELEHAAKDGDVPRLEALRLAAGAELDAVLAVVREDVNRDVGSRPA